MASYSLTVENGGLNTGSQILNINISGLGNALGTYLAFRLTTGSGPNTTSALTSAQITTMNNNSLAHFARSDNWDSSSTATSIDLQAFIPSYTYTIHMTPASSSTISSNVQATRLYAQASNSSWYQIGTTSVSYYKGYAWMGVGDNMLDDILLDLPAEAYTASWTLNSTMATACNNVLTHTVSDPLTSGSNIYKSGGGYVDFTFDLAGTNRTGNVVPNNAGLYRVKVQVRGARENATTDATHVAKFDLYTGDTLKTEGSQFTSTTAQTITINSGVWTGAELQNAKLRFSVAAYGGKLFGISWILEDIVKVSTSTAVNVEGLTRFNNDLAWYTKIGVYATTTAAVTRTSVSYSTDFQRLPVTISGLSSSSTYTLFFQDKSNSSLWYRIHTEYIPGDQSVSTSDTRIFRFRICTPITVSSAGTINYDGSAHSLVTTTNGLSRTTYYKIGANGSWSTTIPSATEAGTYDIYWYSNKASTYCLGLNQGTADHPMGPITTTIRSTTPTYIAPTGKTLNYTGNAQILINEGTCTNGVLWYKIGTSGTWTDDVDHYIKETNAGTYTIYYYVKGNTGYSDIGSQSNPIGSVNTIINKVDPVLTAPTGKTELIYTGSAQQLINAGSSSHGTFYYKLSTSSSFSTDTTSITGTNAGTYTIQWYLLGDNNHNDYGRETGPGGYEYEELTVTIDNKPTATWSTQPTIKTNLTYTGSAQQLINAGASSGGTPYYRIGTSGTWQTSVTVAAMKGTNAGTYTVQCYIAGDSTHTDSSILTLSPVINKANIPSNVITAPTGVSVYYDGNYHQLVNAGSISSTYGTMYYKQDGPGQTWVTDAAVITASEEGEYWTYWKITGSSNYNDYTPSPEYVVSTISAMPTPTYTAPTGRTVTWTTGNINLVDAGNVTNGSFYYKVGTGSWSQADTIPTTTAVGTYTIYWYIKGNTGYADIGSTSSPAGSVTTTINKANITQYTAPTVKTSLTYTSSSQQLIDTQGNVTNNYGTMYYKCPDTEIDWTQTASNIIGTNAGDYLVYYYIVGDSNHNNVGSTSSPIGYKTATIGKAASSWSNLPAIKTGLKYTGSAQALINLGSAVGGTAKYKLSSSSTWLTTAPTASAVGSYYVDYMIVGDANHNDTTSAQTDEIVISKGNAYTWTQTPQSKVLASGTSQALVTAGTATGGTKYYKLSTASSYSTSIPTASAAGTYTVNYYIAGGTNYEDSVVGSVTSYIYTPPTSKTNLTYTGSAQTLFNNGTAPSSSYTVQYRLASASSTTNWTTTVPSQTNAATYEYHWRIATNTTYSTTALVGGATDTYKLSVTIDKATPTYTAPTGNSLSYTGSNQQLINNAGTVPTGCTMNYRLGTTGTWTTTASSIQASAVGTYTIYYYITGSSNYTDRGSTSSPLGSFTASIGQSVPTYTAPTSKTNLVYTGSSQQLINAGSVTNGTLYYKLNNGTWGTTASSITGTNAGDYTIYYYIKGNTGYSDIGSESDPAGNIITSIAKADPTYTAPSGVIAYYNGSNITLISGGSVTPNTCAFQYKINSGSWSTTATASSISTDYKVYYYVKGDTNYNDIGSTSNPIGYVTSQILSSVAVYNGTQWVRSSVTGYYESNSIYSKCLIYYYDGSAWQLCGYQEN